ncbi:MAG: hypothetical protein JSV96_06715 [Candidatus Aminicenantes bacterium]|nr:MAG: hypothetical protein JSV96_06715 [Candidatus Aminicenantes bacterium]
MAEAGQVEQKQKRPVSPIIILVLALIFMIWLMLLFTNKSFYDDFGMNLDKNIWVYIASIIMIIFIAVLLVAAYPARAQVPEPTFASAQITPLPQTTIPASGGVIVTSGQPLQAVNEPMVVEAEPLVVEAEVVEVEPLEEEVEPPKALKTKKPRLIEYPKKVPGGVYGDTIVRVDPRTKLNLRTLLVRSCMICDRQGKCWEEIMDTIPRDDFLMNIDCKKGLRRLKGPGMGGKRTKRKRVKRVTT